MKLLTLKLPRGDRFSHSSRQISALEKEHLKKKKKTNIVSLNEILRGRVNIEPLNSLAKDLFKSKAPLGN